MPLPRGAKRVCQCLTFALSIYCLSLFLYTYISGMSMMALMCVLLLSWARMPARHSHQRIFMADRASYKQRARGRDRARVIAWLVATISKPFCVYLPLFFIYIFAFYYWTATWHEFQWMSTANAIAPRQRHPSRGTHIMAIKPACHQKSQQI